MIGVKAICTLERTLYLDLPDNIEEEKIIEEAKKEIQLPINALYSAYQVFNKLNVKVKGLDLKDWDATNVKYEIIK